MAKEVRVQITADASGAVRATGQTVQGLDNVSKAQRKAQSIVDKSNESMQNGTQKTTQSVSELGSTMQGLGVPGAGLITTANRIRTGFQGLIGSSNALRISLMALPFVAIAAAVITLFQAFRSTQEGSDRLARVTERLRQIFGALWGQVQQLSLTIVDAFNNPREAVRGLWEAIKTNLMNRVRGVIDSFGALGRAIQSVIRLDMDGLKQAGTEFRDSYIQALTGVEDAIGKVSNAYRGFNNLVDESIERANRIRDIEEEIGRLRIEQTVPLARMRREYEELRNIARDSSLSEQERLDAVRQARRLSDEMVAMEKEVLDLQIEQLELKQQANDTDREEELQLQKLIAQREELSARAQREQGRLVVREASIVKSIEDRISAEEQANVAFITGLEERANKYQQLLLTEDELREQAIQRELEQIEELVENEILTREQGQEIIDEINRRANQTQYEQALQLADRLRNLSKTQEEELKEQHDRDLQKLQTLHENQLLSKEEFNDLRIALEEEYYERLNQLRDDDEENEIARSRSQMRRHAELLRERLKDEEITAAEIAEIHGKLAEIQVAHIHAVLGEALAAEIRRINSLKDFGREAIRVIAREAAAAAMRSIVSSTPFPASLFLAPIAGAAIERMILGLVNFNTGGRVGDRFGMRGNFGRGDNRLIAAHDSEVILNQAQQQAIGHANLARAGVPGFAGGSVSLDASGFDAAVSEMKKGIPVIVDIDDLIRKIEDRQRINQQRLIT